MITTKELSLVIDEYCANTNITDPEVKKSIVIGLVGKNGNGDNMFSVQRLYNPSSKTRTNSLYELQKTDVDYLSSQQCLKIQKRYGDMGKAQIINWVKQQVNIHLLESDIDRVVIEPDAFTVVISADSMRFKNSFKLYRI